MILVVLMCQHCCIIFFLSKTLDNNSFLAIFINSDDHGDTCISTKNLCGRAYAYYWKVVGLSSWLALFFSFVCNTIGTDYKLTNNGYNESVSMRFLQNLIKREGKM